MTAHVPHQVPPAVGDRRVLSLRQRAGTARRGLKDRTAAEAALEPEPPGARRVGWGFISLYTLAYMST